MQVPTANKPKNTTNKSAMKNIRFPFDLLDQIETDNFSAWVIQACRNKLKNPSKSTN